MADLPRLRGRPAASEAPLISGRIVDAAWQVLLEAGPEQFSLDRVASIAHASKQTIYARFSGKRELLQALLTARTGLMLAEFDAASASGDIGAVIADVTRRSVTSLTAPEVKMLERLVDWIDNSAPEGTGSTRDAIYLEIQGLLQSYLASAVARGELVIADIDAAARFWLDGLTGHVRGVPRGGSELDQWAQTFARYFLRAVSEE